MALKGLYNDSGAQKDEKKKNFGQRKEKGRVTLGLRVKKSTNTGKIRDQGGNHPAFLKKGKEKSKGGHCTARILKAKRKGEAPLWGGLATGIIR